MNKIIVTEIPTSISFQLPTELSDYEATVNAFCEAYKYKEFLEDEVEELITPNPESPEDFMVRKVEEYIQEIVVAYRCKQYDQGELTLEQYQLGKDGWRSAIKSLAKEKVKINKI